MNDVRERVTKTTYTRSMRQQWWAAIRMMDGQKRVVRVDEHDHATWQCVSWTDTANLLTYERLLRVLANTSDLDEVYAGIVLGNDAHGLIMMDADGLFGSVDNTRAENERIAHDSWILQYLLQEYGDRVLFELSVSCRGFHAYVLTSEAKVPNGLSHIHPFEQYESGRYFCTVGRTLNRLDELKPADDFADLWSRMMRLQQRVNDRRQEEIWRVAFDRQWNNDDIPGADASAEDQSLLSKLLLLADGDAEAAVLLFRCSQRRPHGSKGSDYDEWERLLEHNTRSALELLRPLVVADKIVDAPHETRARLLPQDYLFDAEGIREMRLNRKGEIELIPVTDVPVVFVERLIHVDTGTVHLTVAWKRGSQWQCVTRDRATFVNDSKIGDLANDNFPVGSHNKKALAKYLYALDAVNHGDEGTRYLTSHLGWQRDGSFVWGVKRLVRRTAAHQSRSMEPHRATINSSRGSTRAARLSVGARRSRHCDRIQRRS